MSTQFNITDATYQYARNQCTPVYAPTTYGQVKFAISCLPSNATSSEGIKCVKPIKLTNDADCAFMVSGGWDKITKRQEEPKFYCYTLCQELRNNAAISSGVSPVAKASPSVNASVSAAPSASPSSHSAAPTLHPNFLLSFFTLLFFMFVFFKPKH